MWIAGSSGPPKASYYHGILKGHIGGDSRRYHYYLIPTWVGTIVELLVVLPLIKHFFGVGWIKVVVIAILAVIIALVNTAILTFIGLAFLGSAFKGLIPGI